MFDARFWREPSIRRGALVTLAVVLLALLGPWLAPHAPTDMLGGVYGPPEAGAPLGHDFLGHDVLSRLLAGGLSILWMSVAAAGLALLVGSVLGMVVVLSGLGLGKNIIWLANVWLVSLILI